jgi:hypothetical protein
MELDVVKFLEDGKKQKIFGKKQKVDLNHTRFRARV